MDVHGRARLAFIGFGHEGRVDAVLHCRLTHGAFEEESLIGDFERVAVIEIDLDLSGT